MLPNQLDLFSEQIPMSDAIGLIETKGLVAAVQASDAMLKAANVTLVKQLNIGAAYITTIIKGDVGSVRAAVDAGAAAASKLGQVISVEVIPRPHEDIAGCLPKAKAAAPAAKK